MLIPVVQSELFRQDSVAYDVYDSNGQVLLRAGESVKQLKRQESRSKTPQYYRSSLQLTVYHEGVAYTVPSPDMDLEERFRFLEEEDQTGTLYSDRLDTRIFKAMRGFWKTLEEGKAADMALLDIVGDQLVGEIIPRIDEVMYLTQLRVRDPYTYSHTLDVATMSIALATKLELSHAEIKEVAKGALLHDLGKLIIPKTIMFKVSRLNQQEFDVMKLHPELGYKILRNELKLPDPICLPARQHQEMNGGGGYPFNLKGDEIHFYSQIVKLADVYDALTSRRPYKEPLPQEKALTIMCNEGEKSFNPDLLKTFCQLANFKPPVPQAKEPEAQAVS